MPLNKSFLNTSSLDLPPPPPDEKSLNTYGPWSYKTNKHYRIAPNKHLHCLFTNYSSSVGGPKEGSHISAGTESESSISGIVHSVHIRTGQSDMSGPQVMSGTTMVNANPTNPGASAMPNPNSVNQNNLTSSLRRTASR